MKKIIAAFDGLKYSTSTRDYAITIAKQTDTHLVGVFLDDPVYSSYKIYDIIDEKEGVSEKKMKILDNKDKSTRLAAAKDFETGCKQQNVAYSIHHDRNIALQELKHESIYADLLIINAKETLSHYPQKLPTRFIRELLSDTQCPVLIVPQKYKPINRIILLYDGAPSSVYAVKMFSYLMAPFNNLETEIISINPIDDTLHLPDNKLMKEFIKWHYPKAIYTIKKGWAEEEIVKHLKENRENALVVLGAYNRGTVSRWFKKSMADVLMKKVKLPLFIAHNK